MGTYPPPRGGCRSSRGRVASTATSGGVAACHPPANSGTGRWIQAGLLDSREQSRRVRLSSLTWLYTP
eukprot:3321597-Pyramimonas_sp.AAC.1